MLSWIFKWNVKIYLGNNGIYWTLLRLKIYYHKISNLLVTTKEKLTKKSYKIESIEYRSLDIWINNAEQNKTTFEIKVKTNTGNCYKLFTLILHIEGWMLKRLYSLLFFWDKWIINFWQLHTDNEIYSDHYEISCEIYSDHYEICCEIYIF